MASKQNFQSLTGLRGICALVVILTHVGEASFDFAVPPGLAVAGDKAVYFFFVLSGFLLTYRAFCEILPSPPQAQSVYSSQSLVVMPTKNSVYSYFIRRFFRIYPTYFVVLLIYEDCPYPQPTG